MYKGFTIQKAKWGDTGWTIYESKWCGYTKEYEWVYFENLPTQKAAKDRVIEYLG
jgi:hypothetical protein